MSVRSRRTFQQLVTLPDGAVPLAEAALLMACEEYPQLEISPYLDRLDQIADAVKPHLAEGASAMDTATAINEVLFVQFEFKGNSEDYYDPRNSFFNDVLDRRLGIPITLSALYIEVARRLRFPISGVGFPGHFIVKYTDAYDEFFLDPFDGGAILTVDDCRERFASAFGETAEFSDRYLARVSHRQMLSRMLQNLKKIYLESQSFDKGLSIVDMMLMVEPDDISQYRDRGLLRVQLKQFEKAARDLQHYIKLAADSDDREKVEEQLKDLRRIQAMMN
jgi:regulator of sirC expression with transglutaminase-like and TPR domain